MSRVERALERIATALVELGHGWALIGGLAVSVRAEPRLTRDVDLAVAVSNDAEAEALVHSLGARGYAILTVIEHESQERLATVRLAPPGEGADGVVVDLLFGSSGIESDVVALAEPIEVLPGLEVPVARTGHLVALKILARDDRTRPQDRIDLLALLRDVKAAELTLARAALRQIGARGFARGKDLLAELDALLADGPTERRR